MLRASVSPLVRWCWCGVTGERSDTQHGSAATSPALPAQHQPALCAGCRREACHAGKGVALSQPAQAASPGSSTAGTAPCPSTEEGARMQQQWQSRAASPSSQADTFIPPLLLAG